jgi:type I restriction enzyme S subunit
VSGDRWPLVPIKALVELNPEVLPEDFPAFERISYVEIADVDEFRGISWNGPVEFGSAPTRARRPFRSGDVLVSTVRTYLRAVAGAEDVPRRAVASSGFAVLRPRRVHPRFLKYAVLNPDVLDEVLARSVGVSYPAINASDLVAIKIAVPDGATQSSIANFLDRETAEIDAFIADQEELVRLLTERRVAVLLHHTLGLELSTRASLGQFLRKANRPVLGPNVVTAFRDGQVTARANRREEGFTMSESNSGYQGVAVGDLVFHGLDGFSGAVGVSESMGCCSPVYHVCSAVEGVDPSYMALHLRALGVSGFLEAYAWSVRQRSVDYRNWMTFSKLPLALPKLSAQRTSVKEMEAAFAEIDLAVSDAREAIALSRERRAALISAAVTGKIDVRGHAHSRS